MSNRIHPAILALILLAAGALRTRPTRLARADRPRPPGRLLRGAGAPGPGPTSRAGAAGPRPRDRVLGGRGALGDWASDAPGIRRKITVADLATPYDTPSADNHPKLVARPEGAWPKAPQGFQVTE